MNYITSCPECNTQFLISQEHLKAYRGKVQCGHCNHVFNAKNRLTEIAESSDASDELLEAVESEETPSETLVEPPADSVELVTTSATTEPVETSHDENTLENPIESESIAKPLETPVQIEDLATQTRLTITQTKSPWGLYFLGLLLALVAILQSLYFMRTEIAANYPQFKPLLVSACAPLHCKVDLPKKLDLLLIDDSDMQEDETYQSVINFNSALINNANFSQAYPNIELTFTDMQDEPVIRTLLKPQQYLKSGTNIEEGIAAREEVRIALPIHVKDIVVAGYRVQLTY